MDRSQRATKDWIKAVAAHLNLSPSRLALNSKCAASTVTRYLNDTTNTIGISQKTLDAIARYSGYAVHKMPGQNGRSHSSDDAIAISEVQGIPDWIVSAVEKAINGKNGREALVIKSWTLDLAGILPDDVIVIDQAQRPKAGDVVCAQIHDDDGSPETIIRLYDAPYIITHSAKLGAQKPLMVDEDRVTIRGVAIATMRARH